MSSPPEAPPAAAAPARYRSLDGLRGVAALIVVAHHVVLADPRAGDIWYRPGVHRLNPVEYAAFYSPAHIVWAGTEAVIVFYVLSGFVLALPFARRRGAPWRYFYPRRLLRLYLPAIISLVLAALLVQLVHRAMIDGASPWLQTHASEPSGWSRVFVGSSLMWGFVGLNSSLWSLRWEVLFSLLLPVFLLFARARPGLLWWKVAAVVGVCALWPLAGVFYANAAYIVVFALGVLMAFNVDLCQRWASRLSGAGWWLVLAAAVLLLTGTWIVIGLAPASRLLDLRIALGAAGATLLVFTSAWWPSARRVLECPVVRWLGAVSFSLYLTQEPIVVAVAFATGGTQPWWVLLGPVLVLTLTAAAIFHRFVERPCHRIARHYGRAAELRERARMTPLVTARPVLEAGD